MFAKNTKKLESFIGLNSIFKGEVKTEGTSKGGKTRREGYSRQSWQDFQK
jgi:hypothetical protein